MNETTVAETKPTEKKQPSPAEKYFAALYEKDSKLTRVPVGHLYFAETIDHSGAWEHHMSNAKCVRVEALPVNATRFYVCDFIPAWQCFEFSAVNGPGAIPVTELIPAAHVRRWKRWAP